VKYDLSEVFAFRCEGPNLIVEEFDPCIDVAIRHLRDLGDFRQWQTVAEHLEDKTVLVAALVAASGLAFGEGRSTETALPARITTSGLAELPIELRMFMRRTALRETARSLAPRLRWIGLLQNLVSAAFCTISVLFFNLAVDEQFGQSKSFSCFLPFTAPRVTPSGAGSEPLSRL
jgi:hypothetical protein